MTNKYEITFATGVLDPGVFESPLGRNPFLAKPTGPTHTYQECVNLILIS